MRNNATLSVGLSRKDYDDRQDRHAPPPNQHPGLAVALERLNRFFDDVHVLEGPSGELDGKGDDTSKSVDLLLDMAAASLNFWI